MTGARARTLQWRATYEERLWPPLREGNLTLADCVPVMGETGEHME